MQTNLFPDQGNEKNMVSFGLVNLQLPVGDIICCYGTLSGPQQRLTLLTDAASLLCRLLLFWSLVGEGDFTAFSEFVLQVSFFSLQFLLRQSHNMEK